MAALGYDVDQLISIHAPMKGATHNMMVKCMAVVIISIHAPMKGATAGLSP